MDPTTAYSQDTGGGDGDGDGRSFSIDAPHEFEVEFPPTGPLGITFEWAADSTAMFRAGDGSTTVTTPRTAPPLDPSTLPPIGSSPSSAPKDRAIHPLGPPSPPSLPHSLRILSFPRLPPKESLGSGTTIDETGANISTRDDETGSRDRTGRDDTGSLHELPRASSDEIPTHQQKNTQSAAGPSEGASNANDQISFPSESISPPAGVGQHGDVEAFGPVAGRDILRPGDILVEVNGNPVAGPAARIAGVLCFEDAVGVVAATASTGEQKHSEDGSRQRRRVLKFRREALQQRAASSSNTASPRPPQVQEGGWVEGMSSSASGSTPPPPAAGVERDAPNATEASGLGVNATGSLAPKSSWSTLYPVLKLKGWGRARGLAAGGLTVSDNPRGASEKEGMDRLRLSSLNHLSSRSGVSGAGSGDIDELSAQTSWRSRGSCSSIGSDASFASSASSKAKGPSRRRKRGKGQKGRNGSSVVSTISAADRIKADARY